MTSQTGQPLTYSGASQRMTRISKKAGTTAYSLHGLRYSAASKLTELGATDAQIAAITDHKARSMVARYSSGANQKRLADEVVVARHGFLQQRVFLPCFAFWLMLPRGSRFLGRAFDRPETMCSTAC